MKKTIAALALIFTSQLSVNALAHSPGKPDSFHAMGPHKAVMSVDKNKGFKLSKEALKTFEIKSQTYESLNFKVPKRSLVRKLSERGFYTRSGDHFKYRSIKEKLEVHDQVVVQGGALLEITSVFVENSKDPNDSH